MMLQWQKTVRQFKSNQQWQLIFFQLNDDGTVARYRQTIQIKSTASIEKFQLNDDGTVA